MAFIKILNTTSIYLTTSLDLRNRGPRAGDVHRNSKRPRTPAPPNEVAVAVLWGRARPRSKEYVMADLMGFVESPSPKISTTTFDRRKTPLSSRQIDIQNLG